MTTARSHLCVKRKLGQALYGDVWLCEDTRRDRALVAVKQVNLLDAKRALSVNCHLDNPWQERKIARELTQIGSHANVLQFHDDFMEKGSWYIVMEYCNGSDLLSHLQDRTDARFPERVALDFFAQIAQGLSFLHTNGIAHRDISLENVLLHDQVCKLSDFGLSTEAKRLCQGRVGKAYYMAPDVVANQEYDAMAADMWSLGVMLFIMLTGSPLVECASPQDHGFHALQTHGIEKILDAWSMTSCITTATVDLLARLLQVNPAQRLTCGEVLAHPAFL